MSSMYVCAFVCVCVFYLLYYITGICSTRVLRKTLALNPCDWLDDYDLGLYILYIGLDHVTKFSHCFTDILFC